MRIEVLGRAAHGATPWLGENAILRAYEVFREIESLPFASRSSELFDRPSINLGRILGGDALNKVPDTCFIDVDVRYLPEQDPTAILAEVRELSGARVISTFSRPPVAGGPGVRRTCRPLRLGGSAHRRPGEGRRGPRRGVRRRLVSARRASPRWSSGPWAAATTAPRSGCRSPRWPATGRRSWTSSAACPAFSAPRGRRARGGRRLNAAMRTSPRPGIPHPRRRTAGLRRRRRRPGPAGRGGRRRMTRRPARARRGPGVAPRRRRPRPARGGARRRGAGRGGAGRGARRGQRPGPQP